MHLKTFKFHFPTNSLSCPRFYEKVNALLMTGGMCKYVCLSNRKGLWF